MLQQSRKTKQCCCLGFFFFPSSEQLARSSEEGTTGQQRRLQLTVWEICLEVCREWGGNGGYGWQNGTLTAHDRHQHSSVQAQMFPHPCRRGSKGVKYYWAPDWPEAGQTALCLRDAPLFLVYSGYPSCREQELRWPVFLRTELCLQESGVSWHFVV